MSWTLIGSVLAGILALAGIARWKRLSESDIGNPDIALALAERHLAGFAGRQALVGGNGEGAIVAGNGTVALLKRQGFGVAVRRLVPPLSLSHSVEGVAVESGEAALGLVALFGVTDDQVRALEALSQRPTVH